MADIVPIRPKPVECTGNLIARIETGDWTRASGECICPACGKTYYRHPTIENYTWLHLICTGDIVKL